jgi:hypothetical protein
MQRAGQFFDSGPWLAPQNGLALRHRDNRYVAGQKV